MKSLNDILYEHCEDLTDTQHIRLRQALEEREKVLMLDEKIEELTKMPELKLGEPHAHKSQRYRDYGKFADKYLKDRIATLQSQRKKLGGEQ